jgi:hypothetical protein
MERPGPPIFLKHKRKQGGGTDAVPLLDRLQRIYGGQTPVTNDVWGRRNALPSEIQQVIERKKKKKA